MWIKYIHFCLLLVTLTSCWSLKQSSDESPPNDIRIYLPEDKGQQSVIENCTGCHSARIIAQNRLTHKEWDSTITWMQEKQGLWPLGNQRKIILDYLTQHFSPRQQDSMDGLNARRVNPLPQNIK